MKLNNSLQPIFSDQLREFWREKDLQKILFYYFFGIRFFPKIFILKIKDFYVYCSSRHYKKKFLYKSLSFLFKIF